MSNTLRLCDNKTTESKIPQAAVNNTDSSTKTATTPPPKSSHDFDAIYNDLHSKFPEIINLDKPILLAVGIRKEMSQKTGISGVILGKWIAWYFRKSKYYALHKEGAIRYNLDGTEASTVTEKQLENMGKRLAIMKRTNLKPPLDSKGNDSDDN